MTCRYYINTSDIIIPLVTIPAIDLVLCKMFGTISRWFQLHSVINFIIVSIIYQDVIRLYINALQYNASVDTKIECYYILFLHIYHLFIKKLSFMDYFHHILFIGAGFIPGILLSNSNLTRLVSFSSCGLTGIIEYFTLALVKHKRMDCLTQKKINSYIYNYIRYPLSLYSVVAIYYVYMDNQSKDISPLLVLYLNFIIYLNGAFYNKLTIENYIIHKFTRPRIR